MHLLPETTYHIYTHANGSENLFRVDENYHYFLKKYAKYIYPVAETFAYCLMPNHLHLAIKIRSEDEVLMNLREFKENSTLQGFETLGGFSRAVSLQFSHLFNSYTQAYNKMYDRKGSLFIPNFKRKQVTSDNYFNELIIYIHNNPVRHGFIKNLLDWHHSSIHAYLSAKPSKVKRKYLMEWLGDKEQLLMMHRDLNLKQDMFDF